MSILRLDRPSRNKFTVLSNTVLEIPTLSWKAKGIWAYLMSRPDDWKPCIAHLTGHFPGGRYMVYAAFDELKKAGLCTMMVLRNENGKIQGTEYVIHESPLKEFLPHSGFQDAGFQDAGNQTLIKTEGKQKLKEEKYIGRSGDSPPPPHVYSFFIKREETVSTTEEEHQKLIKKFGEEKTRDLYRRLHKWKEGAHKSKWKKSDYRSILRWVDKAYEDEKKVNPEKSKPQWLIEKEKKMEIAKKFIESYPGRGWEISNDEKFMLFSSATHHEKIALSSEDFEKQIRKKDRNYGGKAFQENGNDSN